MDKETLGKFFFSVFFIITKFRVLHLQRLFVSIVLASLSGVICHTFGTLDRKQKTQYFLHNTFFQYGLTTILQRLV